MAHGTVERETPVGNHVGHVGPAKGVTQEHQRHDHHGQAQHAACGFQQQHDTDRAGVHVHGRGLARASGQFTVKDEQVGGAEGAHQRKHPVGDGHIGARRSLERGVRHVREEHRKAQVNGAGFGVVEHQNAEAERQR